MVDPALIYYFKKQNPDFLNERRRDVYKKIKEFKKEFAKTKQGQKVIKNKIEDTRESLATLNNEFRLMNESSSICDDSIDWYYDWIIDEKYKEIKKVKNKLWRLQHMADMNTDWYEVGDPEEIDIEKLKQIPVSNLMESEAKVISGDREMYRCPLHNETNASFVWYKDNNSWYCFGCNKGGDIIQLYMELNNCEFYKAIRELV